jgi:ABC-2 type transport system ATP-binding protein
MSPEPTSSEVLLQVSELHRRYGPLHAVRGLGFEAARGEVVGLLGANGAGKTSTMAMIAGVLAPSAGSIRVSGHDLLTAPLAAKASLGYLPETPPLFAELTVDEYLGHCARLRGLRGNAAARAVEAARERCGLGGVGGRLLGNLSKGYRQRAGIAQAIVHDPDVVILDEPTSGLDPAQLRDIRALIRHLGERHAVVLSTHILPEAQEVCDRVLMVHEGRLALDVALHDAPGPGSDYRLRLARPPAEAELAALSVVEAASAVPGTGPGGLFRLTLAPGEAPPAALAAHCVSEGWGLLELTPQRRSLEELFIEIACGPEADEPGEAKR